SIDQVLADLRKEVRAGPVSANFDRRLEILAEAMPAVRTISVYDVSGAMRAASRPEALAIEMDYSQRDYFREPQQHPSTEMLYVSPPFRTTTGIFAIAVSKMIPNSQGKFGGVIVATLDPNYFYPLIDSVRYGPGMAASLHHGDGIVFLMAPHERDEIIGVNLAKPGSFFLRHKNSGQPATVFSGKVLATGDERMIAQRDVRPAGLKLDKPLGVAVSRPLKDIYAAWYRDLVVKLVLFGATVIAFTVGLYAYHRRYRQFLQKEAEAANALIESEWKLKTIVETEPECVKLLAMDGTLVQMNRAGLDMIEAESEQQVIGARMVDLVAPEHQAAFTALHQRVIGGESGALEFEIVGLKGGHRWLDTHAVPMRDANGNIKGLLGVTRDVTERKLAQRELERLAQTDALTGLANRRHFMESAEQELSRTLRYGGQLSVLMADIDHFKNINDTHGHQAGDLVLQRLGELCREMLRDVDVVGRIGGEEFAVALPQTGAEKALEVAERLRKTVAKSEVPLAHGIPLRITLSLGVTTLVDSNTNVDTLLAQADKALYEAKNLGRDRVCVFKAG
ncbi:MAG: diguanylate cyclase, partial [Sterolibacterium sp.]